MQSSLYTAATGLSAQQKRLDTISANIANTNTTGYKSSRVDFKDTLYANMVDPSQQVGTVNELTAGSGVAVDDMRLDQTQGAISQTGLSLDFAVEGNGYFTVQDGQTGEILYTRNGAFQSSTIGTDHYLTTQDGNFVLDSSGNRIKLPEDTSSLSLSKDGTLQADGTTYGQLGVAEFANADGLERAGDSNFRVSASSGPAGQSAASTVVQGSLERSNVDLAQEMTLLIRSQRAFSLASRAVTTSDDMMGLANTIHT